MLKLKSHKDLDRYIYSEVIVPMKKMHLPTLNISSPVQYRDYPVQLTVHASEVSYANLRHNYERRIARDKAKTLVSMTVGGYSYTVAEYDSAKSHSVRIFQGDLNRRGHAELGVVISRLEKMFKMHTPFTKVTVLKEAYRG